MKFKGFLFLLFTINTAFGQIDDQTYLTEYKKAVQFYADGQYDLAIQKLNPLCSKVFSNAVVPYAYFYNALAQKAKGNKYQSRVLLRHVFDSFSDWDKINEARLVYADINFNDNFFEEGLKTLNQIQDPAFTTKANEILENYLPKIQNQSTLKDLYYKFPNQRLVAKYLVQKIQQNKFNSKEDLELSDQLTNSFKLKDTNAVVSILPKKKVIAEKIDQINFAVLMPFELTNAKNNANNKYVYDFYQGMKIASENLLKEGIKVNLNAFDVNTDKNSYLKYESAGAFNDTHFFIGPLFPASNAPANAFAVTNKIFQIHPLSNNASLIKDKNLVYLAQASNIQQAKKALQFASNLISRKSVSIYFGAAKKDSLFAEVYKTLAKVNGYKINTFRRFNANISPLQADEGHIFLAADNNLGVRFIQLMNQSNVTSQLICTAASFDWEKINKSIFSDNISIIYPEFIDKSKQSVSEFTKVYLNRMSAKPSYYSCMGYDIVYYFAKMFKDGKEMFKINMDSGPYLDDYLLSGFDYSAKLNENEIVPIIKLNNGIFEEIYR